MATFAAPRSKRGISVLVAVRAALMTSLVFCSSAAHAQTVDLDPEEADETTTVDPDARQQPAQGVVPTEDAGSIAREAEDETTTEKPQATSGRRTTRLRRAATNRPAVSTFVVRAIRFSPSGYLTQSELDEVAAAFIGRTLRSDQLAAIAEAVTRLYADRNIALAQAIVRGVDRGTGTVDVELFEARLGRVTYNSKNASDRYLEYRMGLRSGDLADNRRINKRLQRLAATDGVRVDANFAPGERRGLTDLEITLAEPSRWSGTVTLDNYGTTARGEARLGASLRNASLTGWNDPLSVVVTGSEGAFGASGSYSRVVTPDGARLGVSGGYDYGRTIIGPTVTSHAAFGIVSLTVPVLIGERITVFGTATGELFTDNSSLLGANIVDQNGHSGSIGGSMQYRGSGWQASAVASARFGTFDDRIAALMNKAFSDVSGQVNVAANVADVVFLSVSAAGQYAFTNLPVRPQFTVTSPFAVRGYPTSFSSADSGYWVRVQGEQLRPIEVGPDLTVKPFAFADFGEAFDKIAGRHVGQGMAVSAGAGMSAGIGGTVIGEIYAARPLNDIVGFLADNVWDVRGGVTLLF